MSECFFFLSLLRMCSIIQANINVNEENEAVCSDPACVERYAQLERRLQALETKVEDRLFIADILESSSTDSGVPSGHSAATNGGAFYDEVRHQIISVYRESNNCRDIYITHLTDPFHGTNEVRRNVIPFDVKLRVPIYDGCRFAYFAESGWNDGEVICGRRFGRVDLDTFSFEELPPIPADPFQMFASVFYGCYHHGVVFMSDGESQLCGYDVERGIWKRYGITLPTIPRSDLEKYRHGTLISDPDDPMHLYLLSSYARPGFCRIDLEARTCTLLSPSPRRGTFDCYDSVLVRSRPGSDSFVIVVWGIGSSWHMWSSKTHKWKALSDWKEPQADRRRHFLVYAPDTKTFYYRVNGRSTWEAVKL